jgi:homoserine kinase type II
MPGQAVTKLPPPRELLRNATQALALFHRTTAVLEFHEGSEGQKGSPNGLQSRADLTTSYLQSKLNALKTAQIPSHLADLHARRERLVPLFLEVASAVLGHSSAALRRKVPLQPCIRDIHAGHVLFTRDQVTGLIDFDAMRVDSVATDLARLLGSYCGDDFELWDAGLAAYDEIRPLSKDERQLVVHYDRFAILLTGLQWLDWMLLEDKQFELARVLPRIDATLARLEHLRDTLRIGDGRLIY